MYANKTAMVFQTFSVCAFRCARTHVGAAIFVQIGAGQFSEIVCGCVRKSLLRCGRAGACQHLFWGFVQV